MFGVGGFLFPPRWLPVIDGEFLDRKDAFVPVSPYSDEGIKMFNSVPFMFGTTSNEGLVLTSNLEAETEYAAKVDKDLREVIVETVVGR